MTIRPAAAGDVPAIIELERSAPTAAHWSLAQYEAMVNAPQAAGRVVLVADDDGRVDGFIVWRVGADEWEIENVVVAEAARRSGLGRQLVEALLKRARDAHARAVFLEVRESNLFARGLYRACGFQKSGRRRGYYNCPTEDAILYTLVFS